MGCDIHLHTEVKINGQWEHYSAPSVRRTYLLFALMANVRNNFGIEPISLPKGLPRNLSKITKMSVERWDSDGHSHSWLGAEEIETLSKGLPKAFVERWGKYDEKGAVHWIDLEEHYVGYLEGGAWTGYQRLGIEDIRFVFWFDN